MGGVVYIYVYIYIYIYPPIPPATLCDVVERARSFFFVVEKMTSLEISDMYFDIFDVLGQYLVNI